MTSFSKLFLLAVILFVARFANADDMPEKSKEDDNKGDNNKEDDKSEGKYPDCKGDPHFTGADNSHFDFSGVPNTTYCLISDSHVHMNAYFGGYFGKYEENPSKPLNWIRKIGLLWGLHSILFEAREGHISEYGNGYMSRMEVDGEEVTIAKAGQSVSKADGSIVIAWEAARELSGDDEIDVYSVEIVGVFRLVMKLRPELRHFRTETDGTVHFDFEITQATLSENVHGVLGQTFRSDHKDRLSKQNLVFSKVENMLVVPGDNGEGFLDEDESAYRASAFLLSDCKVSRFNRANQIDGDRVQMATLAKSVGEYSMSRKMLRNAQ